MTIRRYLTALESRPTLVDELLGSAGSLAFAIYGWHVLAGNFDKLIGFSDWDQWYESQWVA